MYLLYINNNIYNFQTEDLEFSIATNPNGSNFTIDTRNLPIPEVLDVVKLIDDENNNQILYTGYIQTIDAVVEPNQEYNYIYKISSLSLLNILSDTIPSIYYPNDRVSTPTLENILNDLLNLYSSRLHFNIDIQAEIPYYEFEVYNTASLSLYDILEELAKYANMVMYIDETNTIIFKIKNEPCSIVMEKDIYDVDLNIENQVYTNVELTNIPIPSNLIYGDRIIDPNQGEIDDPNNKPYILTWKVIADPESTDPDAWKWEEEVIQDVKIDTGYKLLSGTLTVRDVNDNIVQPFENYPIPIKSEKVDIYTSGGGSAQTSDRQQLDPFLLSGNNIIGNKNYTPQSGEHYRPTFYGGYKLYFNVFVEKNIILNQTNITLRNRLRNRTNNLYNLTISKKASPSNLTQALMYIEQLSTNHEKPDIHLTFKTRNPMGFSLLSPVMVDLPQRGIDQQIYYIQEIKYKIFSAYNLSFEYEYTLTNKKSIILGEEYFTPLTKVRESDSTQESYIYNDEQYYTEEYTVGYPYYNYVVDENANPLGNLSGSIELYLC